MVQQLNRTVFNEKYFTNHVRQVGHDESGRPVIYANFAQAATHKNSVEDVVTHVTYLIESAKATMEVGVTTWVFVIDCTGMTLNACNPKLGYGMANILSNHYPERLGLVICVNHNPMFHGVWKALRKVVSPGTSAKVRLVRSLSKVQQVFATFFSDELSSWLLEEIELNKQRPLPKSQLEFWAPPPNLASAALKGSAPHDPRGSPAYIRDYVVPFQRLQDTSKTSRSPLAFLRGRVGSSSGCSSSSSSGGKGSGFSEGAVVPRHRPHPNIVDSLFGAVLPMSTSAQEQEERLMAMSGAELGEGSTTTAPNAQNGAMAGIGFHRGEKLREDYDLDDDDDDDGDIEIQTGEFSKRKTINGNQ
ncbi:CRAL-TRIO domain-containing protein C365.01 [Elysia marginata]|uniref:CRAL-TRIO domain-containing protein C365.01 n=1 Tax=Elysia marginata TaxID=1093978 RepID=A0AAV4H1V2_9GAST|nr:CRAL-TRIO domain-containing protein C365.01 [Elysia marginata]